MRSENVTPLRDHSIPEFSSWLIAFTVTMLLSGGFMMMLNTSFNIGFELGNVLLWTGISALIITIVHCIDNKIVSIVALALAPAAVLLMTVFDVFECRQGLIAFLAYVQNYIIYSLPGEYDKPGQSKDLVFTFLMMYNLIPASFTAFAVIRRKLIPLPLVFYAPIFLFSVANVVMIPDQAPCIFAATGVLLLVLIHALRHKRRDNAEKLTLILAVPAFLLALVIGAVFPLKDYKKDRIATDIIQKAKSLITITVHEDNPILDILDTAENGIQDPDAMISVISAKQFVELYPSDKDLTKVGPFNPGEGQVLDVTKKMNGQYDGEVPRYTGYDMYLKIESLDKYEDNTLTHARMPVRKIYRDDIDVEPVSGQYAISVKPLIASYTDITPVYTDMYETPVAENALTSLYGTSNADQEFYASSPVPYKAGNIYTDEYLEEYVYGTCLAVPERTRDALTMSKKLPDWYMECLYGTSELSDCDKVRAVTDYVRNLHPYDRNTPYPPDDVDFVPWFVTEANSGICVHYATTTMILLRMIGIPARYCCGFTYNRCYPNSNSIVFNEDAHAWFEFFVPGYGWIMGDSTPGAEVRASAFNIEAVSSAYPEIEDAAFSRSRVNISDITGGNSTPTPTPADETAETGETSEETSESDETTETSESSDESAAITPTATPTVTPSPHSVTDPSGSGQGGNGSSGGENVFDMEAFRASAFAVLKFIGILTAVAVFFALVRFGYVYYWRIKFSVRNAGEKIIAYYRYYTLVHKFLGKPLPNSATEVIDKVAFSREVITKNDLNTFLRACMKSTAYHRNKLPEHKKVLFRLIELKIKEYK